VTEVKNQSIARLRNVKSRSISAENFDGSAGGGGRATEGTGANAARELGQGWKVSPSISLAGGETFEIAAIDGPGVITHIWLTLDSDFWRKCILRAYWDGSSEPAIEVPIGDFFCNGWGEFAQVNSEMISVNPLGGFNSYWPMPFRSGARLTIENTSSEAVFVYYQVTYEIDDKDLTEKDIEGRGYLHAQWNRSNPLPELTTHPIVQGVTGAGHYVGTYMTWGVNSNGWWGEGEVKMFLDDDDEFPTICGTGTEDYFGGAWDFVIKGEGYTTFSTPYLGMPQVIRPDGLFVSQQRFGMYRWHVRDAIHFQTSLRVDIQALGWRSRKRYEPLRDDISSTAFFYLDRPTAERPTPPTHDVMEVQTGSGPQPKF